MTRPVTIIARLAWVRLWRGKTKWITLLLALLPPLSAIAMLAASEDDALEVWNNAIFLSTQLLVLLAVAVHLAPAVGDELESRTYTYLWSRPMPRRALVLGKLLATAPPVAAAFTLTITLTWALVFQAEAGAHVERLARALLAAVAVVGAGAAMALAASALFPRRPLAFVLAYVLVGGHLMSFVPMLQKISIPYHAASISAAHAPGMQVGGLVDGLIGLVVLGTLFLGVALWRVERTEYALPDG